MNAVFANLPVAPLPWAVVVIASIVAAASDIHDRRIPNLLTFPLLVSGLIWTGYVSGWEGIGNSFLACLLLAAPYVLLFLFAGGGAGDAKLMGAIGAWLGLGAVATVLVAVCSSGIILGLAYAMAKGRLRPVLNNMALMSHGFVRVLAGTEGARDTAAAMPDSSTMLKMPYGVAICAGVCVVALKVVIWNM